MQQAQRVQGSKPTASAPPAQTFGQIIQRKCKACENGETIRRKCKGCEEEEQVRRAPLPGAGHDVGGISIDSASAQPALGGPGLSSYLSSSRSAGKPLDPGVRGAFESSFGRSLAGVRVLDDAAAANAADSIDARAFTLGSSIWFGRGEYRPDTIEGRRLLAHEVAHTVQQSGSSPGVQRELAIGSSNDPSEATADRAADAVMRGERISLGPSGGGVVRRVCTGGRVSSPGVVDMTCGTRTIRVTVTSTSRRVPTLESSLSTHLDGDAATVTISVCSGGDRVTVTTGVANPSATLQAAINQLIRTGSVAGVTVTPTATINWRTSGGGTVFGEGEAPLDLGTGASGGGTVRGGYCPPGWPLCLGGEVNLGPDGRPTGGGVVIRNAPPPSSDDCRRTERSFDYTCEEVTTTPPFEGRPPTPEQHLAHEPIYFFFEYETDTICGTSSAGRTPCNPRNRSHPTTCTRSGAPDEATIAALVAEGARVVSVEGFTSPEGPRSAARGFIGNDSLSRCRAEAAAAWLRTNAPGLVAGTFAATGGSELHSNDTEGNTLTRYATDDFLANDPLRPTDPAEVARIRAMRPGQQRDTLYPLMRRAVVTLERFVAADPGEAARLGSSSSAPTPCTDDMKSEADRALGRTT